MLDLLVDGLAAHRLTRLVVDDVIADRPRAHVMQSLHAAGWTWGQDLLRCSWCVGVYVGFGVMAARMLAPKAWTPVARALALADVAGLISTIT